MNRIFIDIKEDTNELNGFYTEGLHSIIPETAIEITEELRNEIIAQHKRFKVIDVSQPISLENLEEIIKESKERPITELEQLRADMDYLLILQGEDLNG